MTDDADNDRRKIPIWRRLIYAVIALTLVLGTLEGISRLLAPKMPAVPPGYADARTFLIDYDNRIREPWFLKPDGRLPGVNGPKVVLRVASSTPDAQPFPGPGGKVMVLEPKELSGARQVLVLGASAAYGDGVRHDETLARQLELALGRSTAAGKEPVTVLNLARPAWELKSVAALAERLLTQLPAPPAAVVLYTGNNEFSIPPIFSVALPNPMASLASYRLVAHWLRSRGWLSPPLGSDFHAFRNPRWEPIDAAGIVARLWRSSPGLPDMSYWTEVRKKTLAQYRTRLGQLAATLAGKGIPLVLVPPPVNLHFFPGAIYPQPVTYGKMTRARYEALAARLQQALAAGDTAALEALAKEAPDGPLQRYYLGQQLDRAGKFKQAAAELRVAREQTMGLLAALPSVAAISRTLAGPLVAVIDTSDLYPANRSVGKRARELFNDSCHPTNLGHRLLAGKVAAALERLWKQR